MGQLPGANSHHAEYLVREAKKTNYRVFQKKVCTCVFAISQLPRRLEKWFCTFFNSPTCAESKKSGTFILELKIADS